MNNDKLPENFIKVAFPVTKDEDGYPADIDSEAMRARKVTDGRYQLDNIPFYVYGLSYGDIISVIFRDGRCHFDQLIEKSQNSTVRIMFYNDKYLSDEVKAVINELTAIGCLYEVDTFNFFAVSVPGNVPYQMVVNILEREKKKKTLGYEDATVRHAYQGEV